MNRRRRSHDHFRESPVASSADQLERGAEIRLPPYATRTSPAREDGLHDDGRSRSSGRRIRSDAAADLVTRAYARQWRVSKVSVQVAAADPAGMHVDEHLAGHRYRFRQLPDFGFPLLGEKGSSHGDVMPIEVPIVDATGFPMCFLSSLQRSGFRSLVPGASRNRARSHES